MILMSPKELWKGNYYKYFWNYICYILGYRNIVSPQGNFFIQHFSGEKRFSVTSRFTASWVIARFINQAGTDLTCKVSLSVSPSVPTPSFRASSLVWVNCSLDPLPRALSSGPHFRSLPWFCQVYHGHLPSFLRQQFRLHFWPVFSE